MADARTGEAAFLVNAVRQAVERSSIRDVAAQAGVSHGGLHNLINDKIARINGATLRKLRAWYVRDWAARGEAFTPEIAEYVLVDQLLAPVPANVRGLAVLKLVRSLERIYDSHDAPRPAWLEMVRDKCRGGRHSTGASTTQRGDGALPSPHLPLPASPHVQIRNDG